MAVEATHFHLFPPQFVQDRENLMNPSHDGNGIHAYDQQQMRFPAIPFSVTSPANQSYYQQLVCESTQPKTSINSESGLTCHIPSSRNRSRDSADEFYAGVAQKSNGGVSQFFGEDFLPHIQQFQLEIDAVISEYTEKMRLELQQRQKQHAKVLAAAIGESMMETLREKDDQILKMARLNLMLQEKVKGLYAENQLWREMAQTNEATANSLRTDLQYALAQYGDGGAAAAEEEEVESCGSSDHGRDIETSPFKDVRRQCRNCGERQCCVLLMPCRHLCLCSVCGSGSHQLQSCPVCNASMTATLHVNMS